MLATCSCWTQKKYDEEIKDPVISSLGILIIRVIIIIHDEGTLCLLAIVCGVIKNFKVLDTINYGIFQHDR